MGNPTSDLTVGIDIGTTSVKAVAADGAGTVVRRARVIHRVHAPSPDVFEHDAGKVWRDGVLDAWGKVSEGLDIAAVTVSAMVPSLCGVDPEGRPVTPGLLYGDARGRSESAEAGGESGVIGEMTGFARALAAQDGVAALWPAQAMANHALSGIAAIDTATAMTAAPLFTGTEWDPEVCDRIGISTAQLPAFSPGAAAIGSVTTGAGAGPTLLAGGTVDALAEQTVADAGDVGDVLVVCGTTLIPWVLTDDWHEVDGLWTVPYTVPGRIAVGGASNAGGLFLDRVRTLLADVDPTTLLTLAPGDIPVWSPYIRGERTPLHDPARRARLVDFGLGHSGAHLLQAAYEAAGFVVRHHIELTGLPATRIVATGGGTRSEGWMQALADATRLPVDVAAIPEGAALGAAFHSRLTAGLEPDLSRARGWSPTGHRVEPRDDWAVACDARYRRFQEESER